MLISKDQVIAGLPAVEARQWARAVGDGQWTAAHIAHRARCDDEATAERALRQLEEAGLAVSREHSHRDETWLEWHLTTPGKALLKANIGKPMPRSKGDRILADLLERVRTSNADPDGLWWIDRVEVFGSYTTDKAMIGDVDVWLTVNPRLGWTEEFREAENEFIRQCDRQFSTFVEQMFWPQRELQLRMKARTQRLDLGIAFTEEQRSGLPEDANLVTVYERENAHG